MRASKIESQKNVLGFSLLEVMVALALLSITFVSLVLVQARATRMALQAQKISIATQLARYQLMECKKEALEKISSVSDMKLDGDFKDLGFEKFSWECHAPKFDMKPPSASQVQGSLEKKASESGAKDVGAAETAVSPIMSLMTDTLGQSVRELAVIVKWKDGDVEEDLRVVTHVVDLSAMKGLAQMLNKSAQALGGNSSSSGGSSSSSSSSSPQRSRGRSR